MNRNTPAKTLMVQGTSSSVGKSVLTAALCRTFRRRGYRVAPFKAQNMSNNAAVCADGSEIGRSQWLQAVASETEPTADMNPVLLKPEADSRSQVIVQGRLWKTICARKCYEVREFLWGKVIESLDRLRSQYDLVVIEGAGSPAELNLADTDMVNMAVAKHCNSPVLLVGDIDRGGVFAQLLGTLSLLSDDERQLVRGLIVNKFQGDTSLFDDGVKILEQRGGVPVLGVLPYLRALNLPEEDAAVLETHASSSRQSSALLDIAVIRLPHIANFDDFDPLALEANVSVRFVSSSTELREPSAIILPGTKSTIADLVWLRETGLAEEITKQAAAGGAVVGVCGGYQMLGTVIEDSNRVESSSIRSNGLGLLRTRSVFQSSKITRQIRGEVTESSHWLPGGAVIEGYEIHMGRSEAGNGWLSIRSQGETLEQQADGAISANGRVWGCYVHGLFGNEVFRRAWLRSLGWAPTAGKASSSLEDSLDRLSNHVEEHIDVEQIGVMLQLES